jgi:hypothetical protein
VTSPSLRAFAHRGDQPEFAGQPAVDEVTDGRNHEGNQSDPMAGGAAEGGSRDKDGSQDEARECDGIR